MLLQQEGSKPNLEKAEGYFKRAISADLKNAQARNNYGTYLYQLERYKDAIEQFEIAGATLGYDQRFRALENMGRIYLKQGIWRMLKNHSNRHYRLIALRIYQC